MSSGSARQMLYDFCRETGKTDLLAQWDTVKNLPDTPQTVSYGSKRKMWWRCGKGHSWQAHVYSRTRGTDCPYCTGRKVAQGSDLASLYPELAAQWDMRKNAPRKPSDISAGTHSYVWWICEKGHSWRAQVRSRISGCGCPVCAGKTVVSGENDLAARYPELAAEWDPEKNGDLLPTQVSAGTPRKVWWRCRNGHSWQASISSRAGLKADCPICSGNEVLPGENDLASRYPGLVLEWDHEKNGGLTPEQVRPASNRKVWWRCALGHSYIAAIASRTSSSTGCPYCANRKVLPGFNDLASLESELAKQWHPTLNGVLTPEMVTAGSHRRVWWECPLGHVWRAVVYSRTADRRCGCPVCAGKVKERTQEKRFTGKAR